MVERQPEKLKVVGSSPIPNKMGYLLVCSLFLIYSNFFIAYILVLQPYIIYIYLGLYCIISLVLRKKNIIVSNFNLYFLINHFFNKTQMLSIVFFKFIKRFSYYWVSNHSLKWKPLFKKSSYFGIYRSTKNQYLNK